MPSLSSPIVSSLLALVIGILAGPHLYIPYLWITAPATLFVAFVHPRYACLAVFVLGAWTRSWHEPRPQHLPDDGYAVRAVGIVARQPDSRNAGYYLDLDLETVGEQPWEGRARLSFFPDTDTANQLFLELDLGSGDRIEVLVRLRPPNVYRNPGVFDYRRHLALQGIYWTGSIRSPRLIQVRDRGWHGVDRLRDWASSRISSHFEDPVHQAIVLGMVLGQRRRLPAETARAFEAAGLIHLLVVSGFNLAVVAAGALWLGARLPFPVHQRMGARIFALSIVLCYAVLVEGDAPVKRATLMAVLLIAGSLTDRGYEIVHALAVAACSILLIDPLSLLDSSFQLTFAAVLGILFIAVPAIRWGLGWLQTATRRIGHPEIDGYLPPDIADWRVSRRLQCELKGLPLWTIVLRWSLVRFLAEATLITVSVQAVLLPLIVESYHRISPVSPPLNLLGALTAALVTPMGLILIAIPEQLAWPLARLTDRLLGVLVFAVDRGLEVPGATLRVPSPPDWTWVLYGAALVGLVWTLTRRSLLGTLLLLSILTGLLSIIARVDFSPDTPPLPTLTFLDVGQGDSTLIELPGGGRIVIDGGGTGGFGNASPGTQSFSIGEDVVSAYLFSRGIRRLDAIVLTHAHRDHMGGLFSLIENFSVGEVWLGRNPLVPRYQQFLDVIFRKQVPIRWLVRGDRVGPFRVLNPPAGYAVGPDVLNDESVVLMLEWSQSRALFTGDFEGELPGLPPVVDVLKVPHHGSGNARLEIASRIPVISVGATNSFGHPHPSKLPALRTDLLGAIRVILEQDRPIVPPRWLD